MKNTTGTIFLPTASALALWQHEITGQLSDGMWENTAPHDHWYFWCKLDVQCGREPKVETKMPWSCRKTGYNIASLYPIIGDRMIAIGRLAKAADSIGVHFFERFRYLAEKMPESMDAFLVSCSRDKELAHGVSLRLATAFYTTDYTMKHLRADVALIKQAMKSVK